MAARATSSQHPDVEALQAELAALEAQKNIVQGETLVIAADKKRLQEECETEKARIDEEIAQKHREGGAELLVLDKAIAFARAQKIEAENEAESAVQKAKELARVHAEHARAMDELVTTQGAVKKITAEFASLIAEKDTLLHTIKRHAADIDSKISEKNALDEKIATLKRDVADVQHSHLSLTAVGEAYVKQNEELGATKEAKTKDLSALIDEVTKRRITLAQLEKDIATLETKVEEYTTAMAVKEASMSERMGAAARLEAHVDAKLQHLKEVEKMFTTEHLARMGYTKTE